MTGHTSAAGWGTASRCRLVSIRGRCGRCGRCVIQSSACRRMARGCGDCATRKTLTKTTFVIATKPAFSAVMVWFGAEPDRCSAKAAADGATGTGYGRGPYFIPLGRGVRAERPQLAKLMIRGRYLDDFAVVVKREISQQPCGSPDRRSCGRGTSRHLAPKSESAGFCCDPS